MAISVGIPLIVISHSDEHNTAINSILRDSGHPVHCERINDLPTLGDRLQACPPEILLFFEGDTALAFSDVAEMVSRCPQTPPLLVVRKRVDEAAIAAAMASGARDMVSLTHRSRLRAVLERELGAHRLCLALAGVQSSAQQYRHELHSLMSDASEAIADVQDGITLSVNPAWAALFGVPPTDLMGQLFMDQIGEVDQPKLKGALVACLRDKWQADAALTVVAHRHDGSELRLKLRLKRVTVNGELCVRLLVRNEAPANEHPATLLQSTLNRDPDTGFYQRHYFLECLTARLARQQPGGIRVLAYLRPDHFSRAQSEVGLLGSGSLLNQLGVALKDLIQPGDLYGRLGGTQFIILLERGTLTDAQVWGEQLCKTVANRVFHVEKRSTSLTCTIGLYVIPSGEKQPEEILTKADKACRQGRHQGGNRVIRHGENGDSPTEKLRQSDKLWADRIRSALLQNRLRLIHQPVVGLHEEVSGVMDTRVRLIDEQGDLVLPADFMPAAERTNLMKNIDRWVIGATFSFCQSQQPRLVFITLSGDSLLDDSLTDWVKVRAHSTLLKSSQVCFQVSATLAARHQQKTHLLASALRASGFCFAIDKVGIGAESLQLLTQLPLTFIKIDGSLMQGLHLDKNLQEKVREIAAQANKLDIKTIAERVASANTMAVLWQLGVGLIQGHFTQTHGLVLSDPGETANQKRQIDLLRA